MTSFSENARRVAHKVKENYLKPLMLAGLLAASGSMTACANNGPGEDPKKPVLSAQVPAKFSDLDYSSFDKTKPTDIAIVRKIFGDMVQYALEQGITGESHGVASYSALNNLSLSKIFVQDAHDYPGITTATYVAYRDAIVPIVRDPAKVKASAIQFAMREENLDKAFGQATVIFTNSSGKKTTYESMLVVEASSNLYAGLASKAKSSLHSAVIEHFNATDNGDWTTKSIVPLMVKAFQPINPEAMLNNSRKQQSNFAPK